MNKGAILESGCEDEESTVAVTLPDCVLSWTLVATIVTPAEESGAANKPLPLMLPSGNDRIETSGARHRCSALGRCTSGNH